MDEVERSAASVEEAIAAALEELGISEQRAYVRVIQEPRSGFLGVGAQPAIVRVRKQSDAVQMEVETAEQEEQADVAADFLEGLVDAMGVEADVEIATVEGVTYVEIWGENADGMGLLIGRHGQTLDALQELVRTVVHRSVGERCRVVVDVEDYRKRRRSQIARKAQDVARRVRRSGEPEALEPMNALERKIVHDTVAEIDGLETGSEGEEPNRRVVIRRTI